MKKILLILVSISLSLFSKSQFIHKIKADSVLITNDSCSAELNLENSTKDTLGFLYNKGNGRTEFKRALIKINDSVYLIGPDTLYLARGIGLVPISKLANATDTNTINNSGYTQEWRWDSLAGASGLKLRSTSTKARSNLQRLLEVSLSGTNDSSAQTTAAGYFSNTHAGFSTRNYAIHAVVPTTSNSYSGFFEGTIKLDGGIHPVNDNADALGGPGLRFLGLYSDFLRGTSYLRFFTVTSGTSTEKARITTGGDLLLNTTTAIAGSILTVESTTKGFLSPRMTATQRNAISSPPTGLSLYNTTLNTNDTYNGTEYFSFGNQIIVPATNTAAGTTGNQTINKVSGTVNIAATGTTVTVTNSLINANSIVIAMVRTNDATAYIKNVVPGAGTMTINLGAAATSEVSIGFVVFN